MVVLTSLPPPEEGVRHCEPDTQAFINDKPMGRGTLFIAESRVSWRSEEGNGFSLEYPAISLHAVSRDLSAFPMECLFLMIDADLGERQQNGNSSSDEEDEDEHPTSDVRFAPDNKAKLDEMFSAMSDCQLLHPDEDQSDSDDYIGEEDGAGDSLSPQGVANLNHLESIFDEGTGPGGDREDANGTEEAMETGQFDDADDIDH